jgi:hypothetical protein
MKEMVVPDASMISDSSGVCFRKYENMQREIGISNAPTVFTNQISAFGPVTSIKLSMLTRGHTAVTKMYDACAINNSLKNFIFKKLNCWPLISDLLNLQILPTGIEAQSFFK